MQTLRRKVLGDLRAQRGAFFAVWLTVVLGLAFYGATYPAGVALIESFMATYRQLGYADFNARLEEATPAADVLAALEGLPGLAAVEGRLVIDAGLARPDGRITLRLISLPDAPGGGADHPAVNDVLVMAGQEIANPGEILVLKSFADRHAIVPGDVLEVWIGDQSARLTVAGLVFAPEYLVAGQSSRVPFPQLSSFGVAYIPYATLAGLTGQPGLINDVGLRLDPQADEATVRAGLVAALAPFDLAFLQSRVQMPSGGVIDANIRGDMAVSAFFSAMFLLVGGVVMAILLARLMESETRRIGTMRALGLGRAEVVRHYLTYPLLISLAGALAGSLLGYLMSFAVAGFFIQTLAGGSVPAFVNRPQWGFIAFGGLVTFGLALLAGVLPVLRASRTAPGLALRPAIPAGLGALARVSLSGLPLTVRQAARNLLRTPARSIQTLLGVILGCTAIFAACGTADSTSRGVNVQYFDGLRYDLQVTWAAPDLAVRRESALAAVDGIEAFSLTLAGPVTVHGAARSLDTLALSLEPGDFVQLSTVAGESALSREDAIWIGHNLARTLGVSVGDTLELEALGQRQTAVVAGVVDQMLGSPVYVPAALMRAWTPLNAHLVNAALVRVADGADLAAVRGALGDLPGVTAIDRVDLLAGDIWDYSSLWINFSYLFQAFGYLLTLVVIFNTVSMSLHERREELAITRALGAGMGEIARTITWEMLSLTVLGVLLSLPLGWQALGWLMGRYELDFFGVLSVIEPRSIGIALVGIAAVVLLAEWLSLRGLRRADLGWLSKSLAS